MSWQELNEARRKLGLTISKMSELLGVSESTYKGWGTRGKVPPYISVSFLLTVYRNLNMIIAKNPSSEKIKSLAEKSEHKATKWIQDEEGNVYHWPVDELMHSQVATMLHVDIIDKGIAIAA